VSVCGLCIGMDPYYSISNVGNFEGDGTGIDGQFDGTQVTHQHQQHPPHRHRHNGAPLTPSGSSPSISSSSHLTPNPHMKDDDGEEGTESSRHEEKLNSIGSSSNGSCSSVTKRDQMGYRNLPGLPNPHVSSVKPHRHHHRHHRVQRESLVEDRDDDDEQNSLVTSSSSAFSVTSPRDATWSDREVEMEEGEDSDNSDESDDTEGESEDQVTHFKPNSTVQGSTRSVNSSPGHSNPGSQYFSEGADERDAGRLQYSHDGGMTAAMGFLPSPVVTSSSPHHDMERQNHSPISPPMASRCSSDGAFNDKSHLGATWNHGDFSHPIQESNAVINMREYFDSRSQNLPGHSPVSADEYEGSEVDYRNSEHGNLSDYEQNTFDNAVDEQNGHEDPSNFRCLTPGSNLPLRGNCNVQQHREDDMLESISSDAMIMIPDALDALHTPDDLEGTGHFTVGLARATATQSFTNSLHNELPTAKDDFMTTGNNGQIASEGYFGTNLITFPSEAADVEPEDKFEHEQPIPGRSSQPRSEYIEDSWPQIPSEDEMSMHAVDRNEREMRELKSCSESAQDGMATPNSHASNYPVWEDKANVPEGALAEHLPKLDAGSSEYVQGTDTNGKIPETIQQISAESSANILQDITNPVEGSTHPTFCKEQKICRRGTSRWIINTKEAKNGA